MADWLSLWREGPDSRIKRERHEEVVAERLDQIRVRRSRLEDADPEEITSRIRNLAHGSNGD